MYPQDSNRVLSAEETHKAEIYRQYMAASEAYRAVFLSMARGRPVTSYLKEVNAFCCEVVLLYGFLEQSLHVLKSDKDRVVGFLEPFQQDPGLVRSKVTDGGTALRIVGNVRELVRAFEEARQALNRAAFLSGLIDAREHFVGLGGPIRGASGNKKEASY